MGKVSRSILGWVVFHDICAAFPPSLSPQALKTKQKVTDQKLQQGEESYSQAKQLFDEITDELYEELPTFFDR